MLPLRFTACTGACPNRGCRGAVHPKFQGLVPSLRQQQFAEDYCSRLQGAARSLMLALRAIELTWHARNIDTLACAHTGACCLRPWYNLLAHNGV